MIEDLMKFLYFYVSLFTLNPPYIGSVDKFPSKYFMSCLVSYDLNNELNGLCSLAFVSILPEVS